MKKTRVILQSLFCFDGRNYILLVAAPRNRWCCLFGSQCRWGAIQGNPCV